MKNPLRQNPYTIPRSPCCDAYMMRSFMPSNRTRYYCSHCSKTYLWHPGKWLAEESESASPKIDEDQTLSKKLHQWCHELGESLCPGTRPDTYGEGVREMKKRVLNILRQEEKHEADNRL